MAVLLWQLFEYYYYYYYTVGVATFFLGSYVVGGLHSDPVIHTCNACATTEPRCDCLILAVYVIESS